MPEPIEQRMDWPAPGVAVRDATPDERARLTRIAPPESGLAFRRVRLSAAGRVLRRVTKRRP